jgi:hypothetical protein
MFPDGTQGAEKLNSTCSRSVPDRRECVNFAPVVLPRLRANSFVFKPLALAYIHACWEIPDTDAR